MADAFNAEFIALSAVLAGVKDIRDAVARAEATLAAIGPAHDPVRRRGAPLQQGAAGRLPAVRRAGPRHVHRRDDRESRRSRSTARCCRVPRSTCSSRSSPEELGALLDRALAVGAPGLAVAADARDTLIAYADGDGAAPRQSRRVSRDRRGDGPPRADRRRVRRSDDRAEPAPLRQGRRGVLRPDLGAAQVGAWIRIRTPRCTGCAGCWTAAPIRFTSDGG